VAALHQQNYRLQIAVRERGRRRERKKKERGRENERVNYMIFVRELLVALSLR